MEPILDTQIYEKLAQQFFLFCIEEDCRLRLADAPHLRSKSPVLQLLARFLSNLNDGHCGAAMGVARDLVDLMPREPDDQIDPSVIEEAGWYLVRAAKAVSEIIVQRDKNKFWAKPGDPLFRKLGDGLILERDKLSEGARQDDGLSCEPSDGEGTPVQLTNNEQPGLVLKPEEAKHPLCPFQAFQSSLIATAGFPFPPKGDTAFLEAARRSLVAAAQPVWRPG